MDVIVAILVSLHGPMVPEFFTLCPNMSGLRLRSIGRPGFSGVTGLLRFCYVGTSILQCSGLETGISSVSHAK